MWQLFLSAWILAAAPVDAPAAQVALQTLAGESLAGELIALEPQQLTLRRDGKQETIPVADLLGVDITGVEAPAATVGGGTPVVVQLLDESRLTAREYAATDQQADLKLDESTTASVPTAGVAWVRFPSPGAELAAEWDRLIATKSSGDVLIIRKDDTLDYLEGVIRAVKPDVIDFDLDGDALAVKRAKVEGFRYFRRASQELPPAICRVIRAGGAVLQAAEVKLSNGQVEVRTPAGLQLSFPWESVARLDYSQGKVVFLSDLDWDPQLYERLVYFGGKQAVAAGLDLYPPQRDRALDGGPLELDRRTFAKGLALHSRTRLAYRLPSGYRRFVALAGLDDRVGAEGNLRLVIEGDGRELFAADLTGKDPAQAIDLDISNLKRLSILVDFGGDLDIADHLNLAEARILK